MTYKDKEKQKEAVREANKVYRKRQKGITEQGITLEGITDTFSEHKGVTLSDGQVWYPENPIKVTPEIKKSKVIHTPNGGYIHVEKLVDPSWRKLIVYLVENLNPSYQGSIRVGINGPTLLEVKPLLEATE